jgi:hypothetical protein
MRTATNKFGQALLKSWNAKSRPMPLIANYLEKIMLNRPFAMLTHAFFVASILAVSSTAAVAGIVASAAEAFPSNYTAHLIPDPDPDALVPLGGVGPGGMDLYAKDLSVSHFVSVSYVPSGGDGIGTYNATLAVPLLDAAGHRVGASLTLTSSAQFRVEFDGRPGQFDVGTFDAHLLEATFTGLTADGQSLEIFLAPGNVPSGPVTIAPILGGPNAGQFDISPPAFTNIVAWSRIGGVLVVDGNGNPMNMGPFRVDEPATMAMLIPGLLAMGLRLGRKRPLRERA